MSYKKQRSKQRAPSAVEHVCAGQDIAVPSILNLLSRLADKSLVVVQSSADTMRYTMLESIALFALEKLREARGEKQVRQTHAQYYPEMVEQAYFLDSNATHQLEWINQHDAEFNNICTAFQWLLEGDPEKALQLVAISGWLWRGRNQFPELYEWLMSAVTHTRADERLSRGLAYALALGVLGLYTALRGDMAAGLEMLETSIARHRHGGDQRVLADLLFIYADISRPYTDANVSSDLLNKVVALYQSINDPSGLPFAALVVLYGAQRHPDHRGLSHGRLTLNMDSRIIFLF